MVTSSILSGLGALSLLFPLIQQTNAVSLQVSPDGGNASSPILYGFMFEDINHCGDGGIYGQLLRNNGFQGPSPNLTAWGSVGDAQIAMDSDNPLTSAITKTLRVDVPQGASGPVGFTNEGYWGMPVDGSTFQTYFWIKGDFSSDVTVRLVGTNSDSEYGSSSFPVTSNASDFTYVTNSFPTTKAPDGNVHYELSVDGKTVAGSSLYFGLVQLFPETYKQRYNGLQPQIANTLEAMKGSFLRFPGGNNLEGYSLDNRWKWNETIGPVENRPGRLGAWEYVNTDGLGLMEYLYWCEDMGLEPILDVWAGFALNSGPGTPVTGDALKPYVDSVMNELEFVLGDASTTYGSQRAAYGRSEPFKVKMVEVGNEDNLGGGCDTYPERFMAYYNAIHAAYPGLTIITSTDDASCLPDPIPEGTWMDFHDYNSPDGLVSQFSMFDNKDRAYPYFVGEYAQDGVPWPIMKGAVAEAVFMIGMERNSDLVQMAAYAPLLQLTNSTQWTPNLIPFTQSPEMVIETPSYYVQQMFSVNRGDTIKEVQSDTPFGPVYWVASSAGDNSYFVKMANYSPDTQDLTISIPDMSSGTLTVVADNDPQAYNSDTQTMVTPSQSDVAGEGGEFKLSLPAWSVAVLAAN